MNIFVTIFDLFGRLLIWLLAFALEREPQSAEAFRLLIAWVVFTGAAILVWRYWRSLGHRLGIIPRKTPPEERFAGRYFQAVKHDSEIRYAIVRISRNASKGCFEAEGRHYNASGEEPSFFKSKLMVLPPDHSMNIEFSWKGNLGTLGYTCMRRNNPDEDYIEGDGYVVILGEKPKVFPMLFKRMEGGGVREAVGWDPPASAAEEPEFVRKFHAELGPAVKRRFEALAVEKPKDAPKQAVKT